MKVKNQPRRLFLLGMLLVAFCATAPLLCGKESDLAAQERVISILQEIFGPERSEASTNAPAKSSNTYTNIEARFREASALMPDRIDLRFGIASALIGQAIQTNSPFDMRMQSALTVYREIHALDTNGFLAPLLSVAYSRAIGETNEAQSMLAHLVQRHPEKTETYIKKFRRIDEILQINLQEQPPQFAELNRDHAIVVLGAMLETNGTMKPKLVDRLKQGLVLARLYPESPVIVTGGNPKGGITEAYMMGLWFAYHGIATNRLHLEDQARDTVGNAIRSCEILRKLGVTRATIVTSASHIRRSLANFEEAALQSRLQIKFDHLAAPDEPPTDFARERVTIYRDVLRTSGMWAYPGLRQ